MTAHFGIGQPVRRKEDLRLVTGRGEFSDDLNVAGQAYAYVLRSPHAHARIRGIDTAAALAAPGVLAVLTGRDFVADGLKPLPNTPNPPDLPLTNRDGRPVLEPPDYPLAVDKVRHAGEGVALIVAETRAAAIDAAELVAVDYEPLPAVVERCGCACARRAGALGRGSRQRLLRRRARRQGRGRRRVRARRACGPHGDPQQPRHRAAARARRGARPLRCGQRPLHAARRRPGRADPEAHAVRRFRRRRGPDARDLPRRRRRLRHQESDLSRICPGGVGGAPGRPSGQVARRAQRSLLLRSVRPRPDQRRRARARRRGTVSSPCGSTTSTISARRRCISCRWRAARR